MVDTNQNGKFAHSLESEQATPQKGEIYWVDMPYYSTTVISNIRPCVVLSNRTRIPKPFWLHQSQEDLKDPNYLAMLL